METRDLRTRWLLVAALVLLALPAGAGASISITTNAQAVTLRVDRQGNAEVGWRSGGKQRTVLIPASGQSRPGGRLAGPDVGTRAAVPGLPFTKAVRRGPGGMLYALQAWKDEASGPVALRFSRWKGAPTLLDFGAEQTEEGGERLVGRVSFQGRPVTRIKAFLDCFTCPSASWRRIQGVALGADGTFGVLVRPAFRGNAYRATIAGPNIGRTLAPDASATVIAPSGD